MEKRRRREPNSLRGAEGKREGGIQKRKEEEESDGLLFYLVDSSLFRKIEGSLLMKKIGFSRVKDSGGKAHFITKSLQDAEGIESEIQNKLSARQVMFPFYLDCK